MTQLEGEVLDWDRPPDWPTWAGCGPLLRDPALQEQFDIDGYVVIPFLRPQEVARVQELFERTGRAESDTFYASFLNSDVDARVAIDGGLRTITHEAVRAHFADARVILGQFMVKPAHDPRALAAHQDWTLVDEDRYYSAGVWFPLCATTFENGSLHVVARSHRLGPTWRGPTLPGVFEEIQEEIEARHLTRIDLAPGEGLVHDSRLLHWSPPNTTDAVRVAAEVRLVSAEAQLLAYGFGPDGTVERHEVNDDYYVRATEFDAASPLVQRATPTGIRFVQFEEYQLPQGSVTVGDTEEHAEAAEADASVGDDEVEAPVPSAVEEPADEDVRSPADLAPSAEAGADHDGAAPPGPNTVYAALPPGIRRAARAAWGALTPSARQRLRPLLRWVREMLTVGGSKGA